MSKFIVQYLSFAKKYDGQSFVEYGLIFSLVCVVTVVVLKTMGH